MDTHAQTPARVVVYRPDGYKGPNGDNSPSVFFLKRDQNGAFNPRDLISLGALSAKYIIKSLTSTSFKRKERRGGEDDDDEGEDADEYIRPDVSDAVLATQKEKTKKIAETYGFEEVVCFIVRGTDFFYENTHFPERSDSNYTCTRLGTMLEEASESVVGRLKRAASPLELLTPLCVAGVHMFYTIFVTMSISNQAGACSNSPAKSLDVMARRIFGMMPRLEVQPSSHKEDIPHDLVKSLKTTAKKIKKKKLSGVSEPGAGSSTGADGVIDITSGVDDVEKPIEFNGFGMKKSRYQVTRNAFSWLYKALANSEMSYYDLSHEALCTRNGITKTSTKFVESMPLRACCNGGKNEMFYNCTDARVISHLFKDEIKGKSKRQVPTKRVSVKENKAGEEEEGEGEGGGGDVRSDTHKSKIRSEPMTTREYFVKTLHATKATQLLQTNKSSRVAVFVLPMATELPSISSIAESMRNAMFPVKPDAYADDIEVPNEWRRLIPTLDDATALVVYLPVCLSNSGNNTHAAQFVLAFKNDGQSDESAMSLRYAFVDTNDLGQTSDAYKKVIKSLGIPGDKVALLPNELNGLQPTAAFDLILDQLINYDSLPHNFYFDYLGGLVGTFSGSDYFQFKDNPGNDSPIATARVRVAKQMEVKMWSSAFSGSNPLFTKSMPINALKQDVGVDEFCRMVTQALGQFASPVLMVGSAEDVLPQKKKGDVVTKKRKVPKEIEGKDYKVKPQTEKGVIGDAKTELSVGVAKKKRPGKPLLIENDTGVIHLSERGEGNNEEDAGSDATDAIREMRTKFSFVDEMIHGVVVNIDNDQQLVTELLFGNVSTKRKVAAKLRSEMTAKLESTGCIATELWCNLYFFYKKAPGDEDGTGTETEGSRLMGMIDMSFSVKSVLTSMTRQKRRASEMIVDGSLVGTSSVDGAFMHDAEPGWVSWFQENTRLTGDQEERLVHHWRSTKGWLFASVSFGEVGFSNLRTPLIAIHPKAHTGLVNQPSANWDPCPLHDIFTPGGNRSGMREPEPDSESSNVVAWVHQEFGQRIGGDEYLVTAASWDPIDIFKRPIFKCEDTITSIVLMLPQSDNPTTINNRPGVAIRTRLARETQQVLTQKSRTLPKASFLQTNFVVKSDSTTPGAGAGAGALTESIHDDKKYLLVEVLPKSGNSDVHALFVSVTSDDVTFHAMSPVDKTDTKYSIGKESKRFPGNSVLIGLDAIKKKHRRSSSTAAGATVSGASSSSTPVFLKATISVSAVLSSIADTDVTTGDEQTRFTRKVALSQPIVISLISKQLEEYESEDKEVRMHDAYEDKSDSVYNQEDGGDYEDYRVDKATLAYRPTQTRQKVKGLFKTHLHPAVVGAVKLMSGDVIQGKTIVHDRAMKSGELTMGSTIFEDDDKDESNIVKVQPLAPLPAQNIVSSIHSIHDIHGHRMVAASEVHRLATTGLKVGDTVLCRNMVNTSLPGLVVTGKTSRAGQLVSKTTKGCCVAVLTESMVTAPQKFASSVAIAREIIISFCGSGSAELSVEQRSIEGIHARPFTVVDSTPALVESGASVEAPDTIMVFQEYRVFCPKTWVSGGVIIGGGEKQSIVQAASIIDYYELDEEDKEEDDFGARHRMLNLENRRLEKSISKDSLLFLATGECLTFRQFTFTGFGNAISDMERDFEPRFGVLCQPPFTDPKHFVYFVVNNTGL